MDFFSIIGLIFLLYYFIFVVLVLVIDCDLGLLWYLYFGKKLNVFKNKIIWITGASSGIGEYLAVLLAQNKAKVILSARSQTNLERVKNRCIEEAGAKSENIAVFPFDLTEETKLKELFEKAIRLFGKVDILVNNAGRSQRAPFEDIEAKVDREMFNLNVFPVVSLSRMAVKYFQNTDIEGHIVVTSSMAGLFGVPYSCSYNASKHALHGYFKTLEVENIKSKLHVTLLCPGPVFSNLLQNCFTAKAGETFGQKMGVHDKRMTTERCAYLSAVAIANQVEESWLGRFPCIAIVYLNFYYPNIAKWVIKIIGVKRIMNIRDSRQTVIKEE